MRNLLRTLLAGVAVIVPVSAYAVPLTVLNFSFESPAHPLDVGCGADCSYNYGPIPGWSTTGVETGVFHPNSSYFNLPLPDGSQTAYSNGGTISQQLAATLQNDTTYTLRVDVGRRLDGYALNYSVALYAGLTLLNLESSLTPSLGNFETSIVSYTSSLADPLAGQALRIVLFSGGAQANFDNVRMDASGPSEAVPEPGTLALLGAGLLAGGRSWRKRRSEAGDVPSVRA